MYVCAYSIEKEERIRERGLLYFYGGNGARRETRSGERKGPAFPCVVGGNGAPFSGARDSQLGSRSVAAALTGSLTGGHPVFSHLGHANVPC
ncbi:hypothetical protein CEXT_321721 [Caerostris extrusa]|uniref:Uncharacterized protein n=1 Tax=Caerostris extrusa TaxID=172846 RepID=A0AAV4U998_CAEEX|nr:hypothetical protein CEXT_321721 [Caerostris extrusa]